MTDAQSEPLSVFTDSIEILIVDDDPDQLFLSQRLVKDTGVGCSVVTAAGGREAVAYLEQACEGGNSIPALVFLDIKMPGMDGFDVLRWIRTKEEFSKLKVIILSSSDNPMEVKRAAELGVDGYLTKHPAPAVVARILREASTDRARFAHKGF